MIQRLWLGATLLLLLPAILFWTRSPVSDIARLPVSPLDRTPTSVETAEWNFIFRARDVVPRGASFTVRAPSSQLALDGYMMALGAMPESQGFPSWYFGAPDAGSEAEYVLDYRCQARLAGTMKRLASFPEGCVYRRETR